MNKEFEQQMEIVLELIRRGYLDRQIEWMKKRIKKRKKKMTGSKSDDVKPIIEFAKIQLEAFVIHDCKKLRITAIDSTSRGFDILRIAKIAFNYEDKWNPDDDDYYPEYIGYCWVVFKSYFKIKELDILGFFMHKNLAFDFFYKQIKTTGEIF